MKAAACARAASQCAPPAGSGRRDTDGGARGTDGGRSGSSGAAAPIIELRNVTFSAQHDTIIDNFSYCFPRGKTTALTGHAGCGKSTILKLAAGILVPDCGEVFYNGADISAMSREENLLFRRESAFVFQDSALWANQTLRQALELPLSLHYPPAGAGQYNALIEDALRTVDYKKELDIRPDKLSMGEQKLIAFARAILHKPSLLFLDEWTESLDRDAAQRLTKTVLQYKAEGRTIIFISHKEDIVRELADDIIAL
ncbi:MAG: ATP-binding cassette domain-containing protein [Spirochaetaceae bacterium]|jgi:ABC-type multidrug transport system ATPase subunit|nr:ATP-binding cassette domain-containing protein [Spirochaetaceae bacterium]